MKKIYALLLTFTALILLVIPAMAQSEDELTLGLNRDFGYSSGGGDIQGTFTIKAKGPENLAKVTFYLDDQVLGEVTQAPFQLRFITDNYSMGRHVFSAVGVTTDGREVRTTREYPATFVTAEEGWKAGLMIAGPIFGIIIIVMVVSYVSMFVSGKKLQNLPPGTQRNYGVAGGTICSKCKRPYARHVMSPNMLMGKLERCPYCGKWAVARAYPLEMLRTAEAAELQDAQNQGFAAVETEEEKLRKEMEKSRYQDV
jgi:hypothetical protein